MAKNTDRVKYLIIGNSAGGIGAAEAIRQVDKAGTIVMVSDEPYPAYSRPLISEYLAGERALETMLYRPADFYEKNNVRALLGKKAVKLDVSQRSVELADGTSLVWEKLLLATGGLPIVPKMEGAARRGVFTFSTLDDARAVDEFLSWSNQAVVIGGGLIGVSVAEALVKRGVEVTIVEMKDRILNTILDVEASALTEEVVRKSGVRIITGHTVTEISGYPSKDEAVSGVTLDDGTWLPCNLVIVAIGVKPRTELAAGAGIEINRGIVVDRYMATSHPEIYACGDAVESYDFIYGANRLTPIWPNAYMGGRVAGFNMAGVITEYKQATVLNSLKYFGLDVAVAGIATPAGEGYDILKKKSGTNYHLIVLKDGLITGMVFAGNIEKSGIVFSLMRDRVDVGSFKETLIDENFSLTSLPEEIWRPRLATLA